MNAILPPRIPKKAKATARWRSPAHLSFVRSHACCRCGSDRNIQAAHVRIGSGAGVGMKPDDWRTVSLCGGELGSPGCHDLQHHVGEKTFWNSTGKDPEALIAAFIKASPKRAEIERVMKERGNG